MSVQMRNSKTIAPIDLIFSHKKYYIHGDDENMRYDIIIHVHHSEGWSVISDCLVLHGMVSQLSYWFMPERPDYYAMCVVIYISHLE